MDINEQKNLATSYNLYSETTKELIQNLQGSIKYKFGIYLKSEEYKDKLMYEWFETEFDSLVSQGMDLIINKVMQLQVVHVSNGNSSIERLTASTVA